MVGSLEIDTHPKSREVEALMACDILNRMIALGGPESLAIGA